MTTVFIYNIYKCDRNKMNKNYILKCSIWLKMYILFLQFKDFGTLFYDFLLDNIKIKLKQKLLTCKIHYFLDEAIFTALRDICTTFWYVFHYT